MMALCETEADEIIRTAAVDIFGDAGNLDHYIDRGWHKKTKSTYIIAALFPEINEWIKQQNPDMIEEVVEEYCYRFKNPELETLFLLRWG